MRSLVCVPGVDQRPALGCEASGLSLSFESLPFAQIHANGVVTIWFDLEDYPKAGATMRREIFWLGVSLLVAQPVAACIFYRPVDPEKVEFADRVVSSRVTHFEMVRDEDAHRRATETLASLVPESAHATGVRLMTDYARLTLSVEETLKGEPAKEIEAIWANPPYSERFPFVPGRYLLALRKPTSPIGTGSGAFIPASPQPAALQILDIPCAPSFVLREGSKEALAVRARLGADMN